MLVANLLPNCGIMVKLWQDKFESFGQFFWEILNSSVRSPTSHLNPSIENQLFYLVKIQSH
jgi:hypothetical protein